MDWFFAPAFSLFGRWISPAGVAAFLGFLAAALAVSWALQSDAVRRLVTRLGVDAHLASLLTTTLSLGTFLALCAGGVQAAGLPIGWESRIPGTGMSVLVLLRLLLLLALVFWLSSRVKRFFFTRFLSRSGLARAMQYTIAQIVGYVFLVVGAAIALQNAGIDLSALAIFAGAAGVGLGLGLQDVARNFVSGIILLVERPVEVGDRIEVNDVAGQVTQIRARSTTVVTNDNIAIVVPNAKFVEESVTNWSHGDPTMRFRMPIGVAYGSDVEAVRAALLRAAASPAGALRDPAPTVFFEGFGESSLDFELAVWTEEMTFRPRRFRSDLNFAIERELRLAGIEIPFPQRDVHVRDVPRALSPESGRAGREPE